MYTLKNGVLYHNGRAEIALGQSYYPSYHTMKVPVPPEGDRAGEMKKDLEDMRDAGFNICRMAALGEVRWNGGDIQTDFPLPDAFLRLCEEYDLAAMVRLQGYSMNLRHFQDATMLDQNGEKMPFHWSWFVRNSLCHPGIYEDNVKGTVASAAHFEGYPSVVSFQIYNEAAYPTKGLYDYHPQAVAAWREWLKRKGLMPQDQAMGAEPPRARPQAGESPQMWIWWREFHRERLNEYLCDMGRRAKEGYGRPENLTCHRTDPFKPGNAVLGEDYFQTAEGMDILGITHYIPCRGPEYHQACLALDGAESAAALFHKHAWLVEYNARTNMPPREWERETFAALGRGFKGILYYQWRADYPYPGSPEPEGFGLLFNDRRKTHVYETAVAMNKLVNKLSPILALAEKARSGVALLYSNHANAYFDAMDNGACLEAAKAHDRYILSLRAAYRALNRHGAVVDSLRACDLKANPLCVRVLILPMEEGLSQEEKEQVLAYRASGGRVYLYRWDLDLFAPYQPDAPRRLHGIVYDEYDGLSLIQKEGLPIPARVENARHVDARLLTGPEGDLACLVSYDPLEKGVEGGVLCLEGKEYHEAVFYTASQPQGAALPVERNRVRLPFFQAGAAVRLL